MSVPPLLETLSDQGTTLQSSTVDDDGELTITGYIHESPSGDRGPLDTLVESYAGYYLEEEHAPLHIRLIDREGNQALLAICREEWIAPVAEAADANDDAALFEAFGECLRNVVDTMVVVSPDGLREWQEEASR